VRTVRDATFDVLRPGRLGGLAGDYPVWADQLQSLWSAAHHNEVSPRCSTWRSFPTQISTLTDCEKETL
jgi:hypothetical protein